MAAVVLPMAAVIVLVVIVTAVTAVVVLVLVVSPMATVVVVVLRCHHDLVPRRSRGRRRCLGGHRLRRRRCRKRHPLLGADP
ncbi:MAG: hypothetical protein ABWZ58_00500, partial [Acidimicrobiia bacterium]